jgi:hypothetical protein
VSASATSPSGPLPVTVSSSTLGPDPHDYIVHLSGVPNAQYLTVTLNGVHDDFGQVNAAASVTMGVLLGDVNSSGRVDAGWPVMSTVPGSDVSRMWEFSTIGYIIRAPERTVRRVLYSRVFNHRESAFFSHPMPIVDPGCASALLTDSPFFVLEGRS